MKNLRQVKEELVFLMRTTQQQARDIAEAQVEEMSIPDATLHPVLQRYERHLEESMEKARQELRRVQARRRLQEAMGVLG